MRVEKYQANIICDYCLIHRPVPLQFIATFGSRTILRSLHGNSDSITLPQQDATNDHVELWLKTQNGCSEHCSIFITVQTTRHIHTIWFQMKLFFYRTYNDYALLPHTVRYDRYQNELS